MGYLWAEIFLEKTSWELYKIYIGNSLITGDEAKHYAKKEIDEDVLDKDKANIYEEVNENHLKLRKESLKIRRVSLYISIAMCIFFIIYSLLS